jgi:eukaryotic-like serine/threonine-protein kinase
VALPSGARLGPYGIVALIGRGGMGEVYRAHDAKLNREVALKVLPEPFALDPDRLARFKREAQLLASLNHQNIAGIHGFEESDGTQALVLELVEGPTLADRLVRGPIPLAEALAIARQIAEALNAAHDHGVIHRDLKPSNIKLRADGTVKVLDFGLAKALDPASHGSDISQSPTLTSPAFTGVGVILGTAAYMAPEQALGKAVDKRADIWAFGVVVFEMLAGKRPFAGQTVTEALASVVKDEPNLEECPARVRRLLRGCLQKNPKDRLHDIADARLLLDDVAAEAVPVSVTRRALPWAAAAMGALAAGVALWAPWRTPPPATETVRTQVYLPESVDSAGRNFTLSPDGRKLAFSAVGSDGIPRVWVRFMDSLDVRQLSGTETTQTPPPFFWSHDSRFIAFSASGAKLKKVDLDGSPPQTLSDTTGPNAPGGAWNRDGVIIFGSVRGPLTRVSESGGTTSAVTALDASRMEIRHAYPTFLPDGRHFLYLRTSAVPENSGVYMGSIDVKPEEQDSKQLLATVFAPVYVQSPERGRGSLLIFREGSVLAYSFDEGRMEIVGSPATVVQQVGAWVASAFFSASDRVFVYKPTGASQQARFQWWDRVGIFDITPEQPISVRSLALSPDGKRAAVVRQETGSQTGDIWTWDTARANFARLTFDPRRAAFPVWSPDGSQIAFASSREGPWNLYRKPSTESREDELLLKSSQDKTPTSMSPDGRFLLYTQADPQTKNDVWVLSNAGGRPGDRRATPLLNREFNETEARFSPAFSTAPWVAYTSDESGRNEVYVCELSQNAPVAKWPVSQAGGTNPRWRADGKELFFAAVDGTIMAVDVPLGPTFQASAPKALFRVPSGNLPNWDVTPDGKRFLILVQLDPQAPFTVWQNWQAALKR